MPGLLVAFCPCPAHPASFPLLPRSLITRSLDIILLVLLAFLPTSPPSVRPLLVAVHLARMAVANATRPLMRSGKRGAVNGLRGLLRWQRCMP